MTVYKIALIPGDGIGPELTESTLIVLNAIEDKYDVELKVMEAEAGDRCLERRGIPLPEDTVDIIKSSDACLKGPVGETAADVIIRLRLMFKLYANIRPVKSYPNTPYTRPDIDMVIVRENTEDVYKGLEFNIGDDTSICLRIITRQASERIAQRAFKIARRRRKAMKVTAVHKSNVMKKTDGMFARACREVSKEYSDVELEEMYVDNAAMQLIKRPHEFDVIVTTNMFGDIISDEASILIGGLGLAPGANIGKDFALFEPVHGSAPKYAGKNVANPTSMILASKMMLNWLGEMRKDPTCGTASKSIERALIDTFKDGILTRDLGGRVKTIDFGKEVARRIS